jgi:cell shape-determining protein MreC
MNYLRDNRLAASRRQNKIKSIVFFIAIIVVIILVRKPIFNIFSVFLKSIGVPVWKTSNVVKDDISNALLTKKSLLAENQKLNDQLMEGLALSVDRKVLLDENKELKDILGRRGTKNLLLSAILAKPNKSPYDSLVIDIGVDQGLQTGQRVFAYGNIFIGTITGVYANTSLVKLLSTPGESTDVVMGDKNAFVQAIGRGGGNFEITLSKDLSIENGAEAVLPGIVSYVVAVAGQIISDPRDPFQKILLTSPVNVQDLKFVQVEK